MTKNIYENGASQHVQLAIEGMTCASCVRHVEKALNTVDGVKNATVNLATEKADINFDGTVDVEDMVQAVRHAGYYVSYEKVDLDIEGMTCASCVRRVEKALLSVAGVKIAAVNLATNRAHVEVLSGLSSISDLQAAVEKAGYQAKPVSAAKGHDKQAEEVQKLKKSLLLAVILTVPVFVLEMGSHIIIPFHHFITNTLGEDVSRYIQFVLTTLVLIFPGRIFFIKGVPNLLRGSPDMNSLVAVGAFAAWAYSSVATFAGGLLPEGTNHIYFEAAAVITTLILLGRWLEAGARGKTGQAIKALAGLKPKTARVLKNSKAQDVPLEDVNVNDVILVRPGEKIPADGLVTEGTSYVDEAMMTGEAEPVAKTIGSQLFGGTVNGNGTLTFRAEKVGSDTLIAQIQKMVEDAQSAKLPIQAIVDKVTGWFVPAVFTVAILTFIVWLVLGSLTALPQALVAAVSVLIVACPCAMGLATPTSIMVGTGRAARMGVLFRRGDALQSLREANLVAFDKTGTLTAGKPALVEMVLNQGFKRKEVLSAVASVELRSEHPIGEALHDAVKVENVALLPVEDFQAKPGYGVSAVVNGHKIIIGADRYMHDSGVDIDVFQKDAKRFGQEGKTPFYAAEDDKVAAVFAVADPIKPRALEAINALKSMGISSAMITGDNSNTAHAIAAQLGIAEVEAEVLPSGKVDAVKHLQKNGRKIAFVGDGINDAPALAAADTGIAIGTGTDVAIESADVVLMSGDPAGVVNAIAISKATIRNIKQNLFWAFGYNVALIPIAAGILYPVWGIQMSPMFSAAAMALSSIFVLSNALRLRSFKAVI